MEDSEDTKPSPRGGKNPKLSAAGKKGAASQGKNVKQENNNSSGSNNKKPQNGNKGNNVRYVYHGRHSYFRASGHILQFRFCKNRIFA